MSGDDVAKLGLEVSTTGYDEAIQKNKDLANATSQLGTAANSTTPIVGKMADVAKQLGVSQAQLTAAIAGSKDGVLNLGTSLGQTAANATKANDAFVAMRTGIAAVNKPLVDNGQAANAMGSAINAAISRSTVSFGDLTKGVAIANAGLKEAAAGVEATVAPALAAAAAHQAFSTQEQALFHAVRGGAEQLMLGVSPIRAVTSEINHLTYASTGPGGLSGAFSSLAGRFGDILTPMRLVGAGAVGVGAAALYMAYNWSEAQDKVSQSLIGIGARLGTTSADINKFASDNSSAAGLSVADARNIAIEFTKTGNIAVAGLKGVGDAVHGYSILTGTDATEATKTLAGALSGDLVDGAKKLDATYGALDTTVLDHIRTLQAQGDRQQAVQVIIDALAPTNQKAAESVGVLTKAYNALANAMSLVKNGAGSGTNPADAAQSELDRAKQNRDAAATAIQNGDAAITRNNRGELVQLDTTDAQKALDDLDAKVDEAQKKVDGFTADKVKAQLTAMSRAADDAVHSILPQIDAIDKLKASIATLQAAQNTPGVKTPEGTGDALVAEQNLLKVTQESKSEAAAYNLNVQEIAASYQGLTTQTALQLQMSENQRPVIEAINNSQKMAAQYAADYANALLKGKEPADALALAADRMKNSMAAAVAAAQQQTQSLKDRNDLADAGNGLSGVAALRAQQSLAGQQAYNQVMKDSGAEQTAQLAGQKAFNDILKETGDEQKALLAGNKAYTNDIQNGTAAQEALNREQEVERGFQQQINTLQKQADASALAWQQSMLGVSAASQQTALASQQAADALERAARAAQGIDLGAGGDFGNFSVAPGTQYTSTYGFGGISGLPALPGTAQPTNTQNMGIDAALAAAKSSTVTGSKGVWVNGIGWIGGTPDGSTTTGPDLNAVSSIYDLKNSQTNDKSVQKANLNEEMAWLQTLPETVARDQSIVNLQKSIEALNTSTGTLNGTMQDALSPYYSQDPRTSHIGFRSQGMSTGGEFTVPGGISTNDNMIGQIPLASGEIVSVRRPGESSGGTVNITNHIMVGPGADKNAIGRTVYQATQNAMRQQRAASQ